VGHNWYCAKARDGYGAEESILEIEYPEQACIYQNPPTKKIYPNFIPMHNACVLCKRINEEIEIWKLKQQKPLKKP
jgi:hypothetical protein